MGDSGRAATGSAPGIGRPTGSTGDGDIPFTTPAADVYHATPAADCKPIVDRVAMLVFPIRRRSHLRSAGYGSRSYG